MPITTGPTPAELLYRAIGDQARALGFGDRLKLFNVMKNGEPFHTLPPQLRAAFERCAQQLGLQR